MKSTQPSQDEIQETEDDGSLYKFIYIAKRETDGTERY